MSITDEQAWGPEQRGSAVSTVRNYTATASSACNALPDGWDGAWVDVYPKTYLTYVLFTDQSGQTASVPAATAAGSSAVGLGEPCPAGLITPMLVPRGCINLCRISPDGATDVTITLRSDPDQVK